MKANDGRAAEEAFITKIRSRPNTAMERFWDQSDLRALNKGKAVKDFAKPSDFLVTENGLLHFAEIKSVQSPVSFPFSNIKPGQKKVALKQAAVGGPYIFYIFSYGLGQWFTMSAHIFAQAIAEGRSSIKFKELPLWQ